MSLTKTTKNQAVRMWKMLYMPYIKEQYEADGVPDYPARCESWNNYTDGLREDGDITLHQYNNWSAPTMCG